jgi:clan AA aspartic protease
LFIDLAGDGDMVLGVVTARQARLSLQVRGRRGRARRIDAVIDTGFTGALTLPKSLVTSMNLKWRGVEDGQLADGSVCLFDIYDAKLDWDGAIITVPVNEADFDPLVGMELLEGYELKIQIREQGKVVVKRLPRAKPRFSTALGET